MVLAESPVLTWRQHDKYSLLSDCGRYSVAKYGSETGRFTYAAWRTQKHPLGRLMLASNLPDAITARLRCEHDEHHGRAPG
jgi:hypothetical protein